MFPLFQVFPIIAASRNFVCTFLRQFFRWRLSGFFPNSIFSYLLGLKKASTLYFQRLQCFHFLRSCQSSQLHEILCVSSLNNSFGGVFQDFYRILFFCTFWDFRKLVLLSFQRLQCFHFFEFSNHRSLTKFCVNLPSTIL